MPPPSPLRHASVAQLVADINAQSRAVRTFTASVELEPETGSAFTGVIRQYHDVRGYILVKRPHWIRVVGQAPVVRTDLFDMVSDGERFNLYVPPRGKFYVGTATVKTPSKNSLENLRPQHLTDALLLEPLDPNRACYFREDVQSGSESDYVIGEFDRCGTGLLDLKRKIWFNRSDLTISRVQLYGAEGAYLEDIRYSDYQEFGGVSYPAQIAIRRPVEDYSLTIRILHAEFNQPIPLAKFTLKSPPGVKVINLNSAGQPEASHDR